MEQCCAMNGHASGFVTALGMRLRPDRADCLRHRRGTAFVETFLARCCSFQQASRLAVCFAKSSCAADMRRCFFSRSSSWWSASICCGRPIERHCCLPRRTPRAGRGARQSRGIREADDRHLRTGRRPRSCRWPARPRPAGARRCRRSRKARRAGRHRLRLGPRRPHRHQQPRGPGRGQHRGALRLRRGRAARSSSAAPPNYDLAVIRVTGVRRAAAADRGRARPPTSRSGRRRSRSAIRSASISR